MLSSSKSTAYQTGGKIFIFFNHKIFIVVSFDVLVDLFKKLGAAEEE